MGYFVGDCSGHLSGLNKFTGTCPGRQRRKFVLVGIDHQFQAVGDLELGEDRRQVVSHRLLRDTQPLCDGLVSSAFADKRDDLQFAYSHPTLDAPTFYRVVLSAAIDKYTEEGPH